MTISTTANRAEYTGNGVTTAFSFPYYFLADADLKVYKAGVLQTITTQYTVSGAGNPAGGTVTFVTAPASGNAVILLRDPAVTQTADYVANDPFPAETHEQALDKLTMISQRLKDRTDRAAVLPDTVASTVDPTLPAPSAGKALLWNADADALENSTDDFNDIVTDATALAAAAAASATAAAASATAAATAETNAETAESNAEAAQVGAEAAQVAAQAAADSIGFRDVIFLTSADSPYTAAQSTSGKLLSFDTSGGAVTVNLTTISTLTLPYTVGIKKTTGDANAVTINRGGTDTFDDGATSKMLSGIAGTTLIPDTDPSPDKWTASDWGASTGQQKKQQFVDGVGFTAGVSTTITITETALPSSKDTLTIWFDGAYQQESEWELTVATGVVTFDVAIPGGTAKIECVWATPLAIGTPADGTITTPKLATTLISGATAETAPAIDDLLLLSDTSAGTLDKITLENMLKVVNGLTEDTTPDLDSDFLLSYDASASGAKKVTPEHAAKAALNASGSAPIYAARAFVNFNGTGTVAIRSSGNVSSVTDNATGDYTVNFTTAMADANYAAVVSASSTTSIAERIASPYSFSTTSCSISCNDNASALSDAEHVCAAFFR